MGSLGVVLMRPDENNDGNSKKNMMIIITMVLVDGKLTFANLRTLICTMMENPLGACSFLLHLFSFAFPIYWLMISI